ncbi:efflux RND transporter periplasmic adaptor subunit [Gluconobacter oxydans]|uniref:efflux RND transporter periplasmic adaptor subunit n=1 Tax=Gluconobacter oxydans TaxID=442 RepID=UPI00062C5743|nr:efflux RND transporter periplasmic adaptor subunit [Gluconobacter oxydans]
MIVREIAGLCLAGSLLSLTSCNKESASSPAAANVQVITAHSRVVDFSGYVPGRVAPFRQAFIRPQVNGVILKRFFNEGADVVAGQQLYQIDPAPYEAVLAGAQAALARGQAELLTADARKRRFAHLSTINAVSQQDFDDATATSARANADIASARAQIMAAQVNVNYAKMFAPIAGRISRTLLTEGELVTADQTTPLAVITQLDPIYVDLTINSEDVLQLKEGLGVAGSGQPADGAGKVEVMLDTGRPYSIPGKIDLVEVIVDPGTGMTTLRTTFHNPNAILLPGMFVHATLHYGRRPAFLVPQNAVMRDLHADPYVLILGENDKVEERSVKVALDVGNSWAITGGLREGDRVLVSGLQSIHPGDTAHAAAMPS